MRISIINTAHKPSFGAGKTSLYADFDETFAPKSLAPIRNNIAGEKQTLVSGYNKFFSQFQNFLNEKKGLFEINISTGRKVGTEHSRGFLSTYNVMRRAGVNFPQINSVITAEGGDIFKFSPKTGDLITAPLRGKLDIIKQKSGWDRKVVDQLVEQTAKEVQGTYRITDPRSSHKLSIVLDDNAKLQLFKDTLQQKFENAGINTNIHTSSHVLDYNPDGSKNILLGIKAEPLIDGQKIKKDFDVKLAIKDALKNKDFVIAAGDADNDKEMLNLFNYLGHRDIKKAKDIKSLDKELISDLQKKIKDLPIGVIFVDHSAERVSYHKEHKLLALSEFMKEQQKIFPDRVKIIKKSNLDDKNYLLDAIKELIISAKIDKPAKKLKAFKYAAGSLVLAAAAGIGYYFINSHNKAKEPQAACLSVKA